MIGRLFRLLFQLLLLAVAILGLTIAWVLFDGLTDLSKQVSVAVVSGRSAEEGTAPKAIVDARLDIAAQLYSDNQFPKIIVSGGFTKDGHDESTDMAEYLERKGVPADAIIKDRGSNDTHAMSERWATIMKEHQYPSVMLVTHYYQITRLKLALKVAGESDVKQAHAGGLHKTDAEEIAREVLALYKFVGLYYLVPVAQKVQDEAKTGEDKLKAEALKEKEKVDKSLDSLSK